MKFTFSWVKSLLGVVLALAMCRLSYWQWTRHQEKQELIEVLSERLKREPAPLAELIKDPKVQWDELVHRRATVEGTFDFGHEMVLRNRRFNGIPGVFLLTPLKIADTNLHIIVNRGFIPLKEADRELRRKYQTEPETTFTGLLKKGMEHKFLAPQDPPTGPDKPWVDRWLRVNLRKMARQLPYMIAPVWIENMGEVAGEDAQGKIVISKASQRDELLSLAGRGAVAPYDLSKFSFPEPVFNAIIPPGRHFGYIFEWLGLAVMTLIITLISQLKRNKN